VIFGFKAAQIFFDNGMYSLISPLDPGKVTLRAIGQIQPSLLDLGGEGVFFRMTDTSETAVAGGF
jgi:hypothetical protein